MGLRLLRFPGDSAGFGHSFETCAQTLHRSGEPPGVPSAGTVLAKELEVRFEVTLEIPGKFEREVVLSLLKRLADQHNAFPRLAGLALEHVFADIELDSAELTPRDKCRNGQ